LAQISPELSAPTIHYRPARPADGEAIRQILAYYVENSMATWRYQVPDASWVEAFNRQHAAPNRPVWVATIQDGDHDSGNQNAASQDEVVGYCCLSDFRTGEGYWPCTENSVYVRPEFTGHGIGYKLMEIVLAAGRTAGVFAVIAGIDGDNEQSIRFHEKFGFKICGQMPKIGFKNNSWRDLIFMQLDLINERPENPMGFD
jgi:L-amino acid N-acyltransferase YncA